jgi:transposase
MSTMADTTSRRPRRRFTDEFKQQAVRLVVDEGKSVGAVARELDLVPSALGQWVKQAQANRSKGRTGLTLAEREELVRLRKALRIAEEERDILKKATAFFAKQSRLGLPSSRRKRPSTPSLFSADACA